jgi:hypothetical protein
MASGGAMANGQNRHRVNVPAFTENRDLPRLDEEWLQ